MFHRIEFVASHLRRLTGAGIITQEDHCSYSTWLAHYVELIFSLTFLSLVPLAKEEFTVLL